MVAHAGGQDDQVLPRLMEALLDRRGRLTTQPPLSVRNAGPSDQRNGPLVRGDRDCGVTNRQTGPPGTLRAYGGSGHGAIPDRARVRRPAAN